MKFTKNPATHTGFWSKPVKALLFGKKGQQSEMTCFDTKRFAKCTLSTLRNTGRKLLILFNEDPKAHTFTHHNSKGTQLLSNGTQTPKLPGPYNSSTW